MGEALFSSFIDEFKKKLSPSESAVEFLAFLAPCTNAEIFNKTVRAFEHVKKAEGLVILSIFFQKGDTFFGREIRRKVEKEGKRVVIRDMAEDPAPKILRAWGRIEKIREFWNIENSFTKERERLMPHFEAIA